MSFDPNNVLERIRASKKGFSVVKPRDSDYSDGQEYDHNSEIGFFEPNSKKKNFSVPKDKSNLIHISGLVDTGVSTPVNGVKTIRIENLESENENLKNYIQMLEQKLNQISTQVDEIKKTEKKVPATVSRAARFVTGRTPTL